MDLLKQWWPLLVVLLLIVVVVRRLRGEPLDLKDAVVAPVILVFLGGRAVFQAHPTTIDLAWLVGLSLVAVTFGALRSATTVIEYRGDVLVQRYRWQTLALLAVSLLASAGLGMLAVRFGMHESARPLTLSIGLGLAGEGAITLLRAARRGATMPWTEFGDQRSSSLADSLHRPGHVQR